MFKNLFDLGYKRSASEAFGFYIVYTILFVIVLSLINGAIANILYPNIKTASFQEGFEHGQRVANIIMPVLLLLASSIITTGILVCKKAYTLGAIILAIISICLTSMFGAVLGTIPIAVLTTFDNKRI